ncbi:MAG: DNA-3-methyladenine glycosylase [Candidatus Rhabdochlamydia sp.]
MNKLPLSFYQRDNPVEIAQNLLGKIVWTCINNTLVAGIISETEAYYGIEDRACHAYGGRRTPRTEMLYQGGGVAYLYLCYGIHTLLNVVTSCKGTPHAVLIRSFIPYHNSSLMLERRKGRYPLSQGPGVVSQALGLSITHNSLSFLDSVIWIEDHQIMPASVQVSARIGVEYAKEDASLPYRFIATFSPPDLTT